MEDNIVSMIMELSTKLANLTDASVFVLVDVPNQRKFSGSQYLVDQYLNGCLAPVGNGNDLELQVSLAPAVIPKTNHSRHQSVSPTTGLTFPSTQLKTPSSRKRRVGAEVSNGGSDSRTSPKKPKNLLADQNVNFDVKSEPSFYGTEVDLTCETGDYFEYDDGENDRPTEVYSPNVNQIVSQDHRLIDNSHQPIVVQSFPHSIVSPSSKGGGSFLPSSTVRFHSVNEMQVILDDLNLPASKIEFLQSFHDTEKLFVKGSPETKIVTSLMYDFGKSLHAAYIQFVNANPSVDQLMVVKPFMTVNLDAFLELFPNLRLPDHDAIRIENRKPKAYLRRHAENSFNRCMRAGLKHLSQDWLPITM